MSDFTATDHLMMARALRLAERGAYTTRPNPMVGCVIARWWNPSPTTSSPRAMTQPTIGLGRVV